MDALELGATLYVPATRADLFEVATGKRYPQLRSLTICLEDSIRANELPHALVNLAALLTRLDDHQGERPALFVRPRDAHVLAHVLGFDGIDQVAGFVIPKASADSLPAYLRCLASDAHLIMPTLETREVFDQLEMRRLREQLLGIEHRVLALRIGGNDLLNNIGARRSTTRTCYQGPLGRVIGDLVTSFAPYGFALSAPVFEHFHDTDLLREEVACDVEHGLITKTAIHPCQVPVIHDAYRVTPDELAEAHAILDSARGGVFALNGSMCEPATHSRWAERIVRRAHIYGVKGDLVAAVG